MFKSIDHWPDVFFMMGIFICISGLLSFFIEVHGARITPGFSKDDNLDEWRIATGQQPLGKTMPSGQSPPSLSAHSGYTPTKGAEKGVVPGDMNLGEGIVAP